MEKKLTPQHIQWIDFAKGLVIILVVAGHVIPDENKINEIACVFRMPFFFIMAGYLLNLEKWGSRFFDFKIKLKKRLLLPYFAANFALFPIWFIVCHYFGYFALYDWAERTPLSVFLAILFGTNYYNLNIVLILFPLWFLPCLFFSELIYLKLYNHFGRKDFLFLAVIFLFAGIGYTVGKIFLLPMGLDISFVALIFILIGNLFRKYNFVGKLNFAICLLLTLVLLEAFLFNGHININRRHYYNLFLFYAGGTAGSLLVIKISMLMTSFKNKFCALINYCGKQTMAILVFHMPVADVIYHMTILIDKNNAELGFRNLPAEYALLVITCAVLIPVWIAKNFKDKPVLKYFCA